MDWINLFICKCFSRWYCITAICYMDFIHRPYVFYHNVSRDGSSLVIRWNLLWIDLDRDRDQWLAFVNAIKNLRVLLKWEYLGKPSDY
jgi:hypothetical protein